MERVEGCCDLLGLPPPRDAGPILRKCKSAVITVVNASSPRVLHYIFLTWKVKNNRRRFRVPPSVGRPDRRPSPASRAPRRTSRVGDAERGQALLRARWLALVQPGSACWTRPSPQRRLCVETPGRGGSPEKDSLSGVLLIVRHPPQSLVDMVTGLGEGTQVFRTECSLAPRPVGCGGGGDGQEDGRVMFATVVLKDLDRLRI